MQLKAFNFPGAPTTDVTQLALKGVMRRIKTNVAQGSIDNKGTVSNDRDTVMVEWYETENKYIYIVHTCVYKERTLQLEPSASLSSDKTCNPATVARGILAHSNELKDK